MALRFTAAVAIVTVRRDGDDMAQYDPNPQGRRPDQPKHCDRLLFVH